ncbi:hypothetical protein PL10110_640029 [Planktothrix agardhii]|nr:hypothetical protein PL10110_640029 [Planktothrix agardhii]
MALLTIEMLMLQLISKPALSQVEVSPEGCTETLNGRREKVRLSKESASRRSVNPPAFQQLSPEFVEGLIC